MHRGSASAHRDVKADTTDSKLTEADRKVRFMRNWNILYFPHKQTRTECSWTFASGWMKRPSLPLALCASDSLYTSFAAHSPFSLWARDEWLTESWKYPAARFLSSCNAFSHSVSLCCAVFLCYSWNQWMCLRVWKCSFFVPESSLANNLKLCLVFVMVTYEVDS